MVETDDPRLNEMLLRWEELHDQGHVVSIAELSAGSPELAGELYRRIEALLALDTALGTPSDGSALKSSSIRRSGTAHRKARSSAEFQDLRFLAEGALGEVYRAQHPELNREVAIKFIKHARVGDEASRRRFMQEAEITARLEHPGIVPVYALGTNERGQPCYMMRLIKGRTLHDAIATFHASESISRDPDERAKALRGLLRRFVSVCNTIAYAHSRGVLHRDIKPKNVMLGKYDETLVVDWGLATPFDRSDSYRDLNEETLKPGGANGVYGSHIDGVGTPQYMSPEQAEGYYELVGPASDTYSLGVMLYVLLVGQVPFDGRDMTEVLEKVRQGNFFTPRQVKPEVPRALEAICLKAMSRNISDRYAKALELADDLERWMADEPVTAWREPLTLQVGRWVRRHKSSAVAVVTLFVCALILAVISVAAHRTTIERDSAREAKSRSDQLLARSYIDQARVAAARGLWRKALESYGRYFANGNPKTSEIVLGRVAALVALNRESEALSELDEIADDAELGENAGRVLLWLADLQNEARNDPDVKERLIRTALEKGLPDADREYAQGLLAATSPEAVEHFKRALEFDPSHVRAVEMLTSLYILLGRHEDARDLIEAARLVFPEDANPRLLEALQTALRGDKAEAEALIAQPKADIDPDRATRWVSLIRIIHRFRVISLDDTDLTAANGAAVMEEYAGAVQSLMEVLANIQGGTESSTKRGFDPPPYLNRRLRTLIPALWFASDDDLEPLIRELKGLIDVHPEGTLLAFLGRLQAGQGKLVEAERTFLRAADTPSVFPIRPSALLNAIVVQRRLMETPQGEPPAELKARTAATVRTLQAIGPISPAHAPVLVRAAARAGEPDLARSILAVWERARPSDEHARALRAEIELAAGSPGSALEHARLLVKQYPVNAEYHKLFEDAKHGLEIQTRRLLHAEGAK
jgi:serine/threonine protein kinase/Flp pilus assembly protein TadD